MQQDRQPGSASVPKRVKEKVGIGDGHAVVGERRHPGVGQLAHLGQLSTLESLAHRSRLSYPHAGFLARLLEDPGSHGTAIDHRIGVGHGHDGHVAAGGRGQGTRGQVLLVFKPGGAEMGMGIDESRQHPAAREVVEYLHPFRRNKPGAEGSYHSVPHQQIALHVHMLHGIEEMDTGEEEAFRWEVAAG